jgi:hypothetical protein
MRKRERTRSVPQDEARAKAREKRSGRTGVPGPLAGFRSFRVGHSKAHVTGSPGGYRCPPLMRSREPGGERSRSVTRLRKWCGPGKPAASQVTPALSGFRTGRANAVGSKPEVATVSQCGGSGPGGFGRETRRRKVSGSHPGTRKRTNPLRIERVAAVSQAGRRGRDRDKIRARGASKTGSPA